MKRLLPLAIALPFALVACGAPTVDENTTDDTYIKGMNGDGARILCEQEIKKQLKSPDSAEFQNFFDVSKVQSDDKTQWFITSYVDADNEFGAKMHHGVTCTVTPSGPDEATVDANILP